MHQKTAFNHPQKALKTTDKTKKMQISDKIFTNILCYFAKKIYLCIAFEKQSKCIWWL